MASVSATISSCKSRVRPMPARGDEGARRPLLVLRRDLRQMLQQGMDEPPAGEAAHSRSSASGPSGGCSAKRVRLRLDAEVRAATGASFGRDRSRRRGGERPGGKAVAGFACSALAAEACTGSVCCISMRRTGCAV